VRFLILADIHANWHALETVLADAEGQYDQVVCCGDIVGYNPHPDRVTEWVRNHSAYVIRGNHDKVVAGLERLDWFNDVAQIAARWTIQMMDGENIEYLRALPQGPGTAAGFEICHGSPRDEDEYMTIPQEAAPCFSSLAENLLFFGHSHLQGGFVQRRNKILVIPAVKKKEREGIFQMEVDTLYMVNPGSVGQPRDGDPRAAYAIYETDQRVVMLRRVAYPTAETAEDIRAAGLPEILGMRLQHGL
jgi:predicted phosphodiesterase